MVYHVSEHAGLHNVGHRLGPQEDGSRGFGGWKGDAMKMYN